MNLSVERIGDEVTIRYEGRLDSVSAPIVQGELQTQLANQGDIDDLVWDAGEMTYLSSMGLRVLLGLKKQYPGFHIIEAGMEVFNILDVTGFTQIIPTARKLRQVNIHGCEVVGKGGVGTVKDATESLFKAGVVSSSVSPSVSPPTTTAFPDVVSTSPSVTTSFLPNPTNTKIVFSSSLNKNLFPALFSIPRRPF